MYYLTHLYLYITAEISNHQHQIVIIHFILSTSDYLPSSEDKVKGLMMRHRTLSESNKGLVNNLEEMTDEVRKLV